MYKVITYFFIIIIIIIIIIIMVFILILRAIIPVHFVHNMSKWIQNIAQLPLVNYFMTRSKSVTHAVRHLHVVTEGVKRSIFILPCLTPPEGTASLWWHHWCTSSEDVHKAVTNIGQIMRVCKIYAEFHCDTATNLCKTISQKLQYRYQIGPCQKYVIPRKKITVQGKIWL